VGVRVVARLQREVQPEDDRDDQVAALVQTLGRDLAGVRRPPERGIDRRPQDGAVLPDPGGDPRL
jgi:hypothetical protein